MRMKVFKFGGASVKDAQAVGNVAGILKAYLHEPLVVVLSAMDKMTNAFEKLAAHSYYHEFDDMQRQFQEICDFHLDILLELFPEKSHPAHDHVKLLLSEAEKICSLESKGSFDFFYDQIVPFGELLSTSIVSSFLHESGLNHALLDARSLIKTNSTWRDASVLWPETKEQTTAMMDSVLDSQDAEAKFILTQGFIGSDADGKSTTLGREGSDFTAAIFAFVLDASEVVIWKDVPGLLNADPKIFAETVKIERLSYSDAIELAYYGAKIIHPKTIKPLQNKKIPLVIRSFAEPELQGSLISDSPGKYELIPSYIFKFNQILISITPRDFSFINEETLFAIFGVFSSFRIRINLMQNSAISFSVCIDGGRIEFPLLIEALQEKFMIKYNQNLELITIRNYNQDCIDRVVNKRSVLLEQRSRSTVQVLVVSS
jgi:aspartate kinase